MNDIDTVRSFNRFYTHQIGLLQHGLYNSPFPLGEVRVLYELAHRDHTTAKDLSSDLGIDPGYLSRTLAKFYERGLIKKHSSEKDGRQHVLTLTKQGRAMFAPIDQASHDQVAKMLEQLTEENQHRLIAAMQTIQEVLQPGTQDRSYLLRNHHPGDIGWMVYRHGVIYAREYAYDERFEALVAEICAKFVENFDPKMERCWIAERNGERVGCVLLVKESKTVARLRVLLVEPAARGLGIGKRLVEECIRFSRNAGYKKITLWTQSELHSARRIYEQTGFKLGKKKRHNSWGKKGLVAETWNLKL